MGVCDAKVTALEFRAGSTGDIVWAGTKEGHLLEVDMDSGGVVGSKARSSIHPSIHSFFTFPIRSLSPKMVLLFRSTFITAISAFILTLCALSMSGTSHYLTLRGFVVLVLVLISPPIASAVP